MTGFINTLKNIWKIDELRNKIIYTLLLLLIYRIGTYVVLPGIDPNRLADFNANQNDGLLGLINMFVGGSFLRASVLALGIMPYISASIAMQLLTLAVPYFQKIQREGDSGRKKITQWTRLLTVAVAAFQGVGYVTFLKSTVGNAVTLNNTFLFTLSTMVVLTAGTLFCMWLGEKITDRGIGNGTSIIIMVGILARLPFAFMAELGAKTAKGGGGLVFFLLELVLWLVIVTVCILLVQGVRKIPVDYARRVLGVRQSTSGARQYLPLRVNASGVMPIIFAQALMFIPTFIGQYFPNSSLGQSLASGQFYFSWWYNLLLFSLIVIFTYLYTALIINPTQMAEDMKRNNGFIPGIKPGQQTAEFIDTVLSRITLPGAVLLGFIAIFPTVARAIGINTQFAQFFGGSSILIAVAVMLDLLQQVESYLLMRHYDGLMEGGQRIQGRNAMSNVMP